MFVALFGIGLLVLGWRLRDAATAPTRSSVQGGGIGVLYLTIYASFALYNLLPAALAFALLVVVTAAATALAVLQDARALAVLGIVGGFLAPVLVSTGSNDHVALFSYYAVLDFAILGIAWFKAWRMLNVLGFLFTFGIGTLWGIDGYTPEKFATTEPFLVSVHGDVPRDPRAVRDARPAYAARLRRRHADVRHTDRRVRPAEPARRGHGVRARDQRRRARVALRRHGDVPVSHSAREPARARRSATRARRRVRDRRRAARARCALDVGRVGAARCGARVARVPSAAPARAARGVGVAGAVGRCRTSSNRRSRPSGRS